jgi:hypothetical protein
MRTKTFWFFVLFALIAFTTNASADAVYSNDISIMDNEIIFAINETYTDTDAYELRTILDTNKDTNVNDSEIGQFKKTYFDTANFKLLNYISIDNGAFSIMIDSITMDFENAKGNTSNETINVATVIKYEIVTPISSGEHELWIIGHPQIQDVKITLPPEMNYISINGLDNLTKSTENGRVVLGGESGLRAFMVGNRTTFEYATTIVMYKRPFYAKSYFLPLLVFIEMLLAVFAIYTIKGKKQSS